MANFLKSPEHSGFTKHIQLGTDFPECLSGFHRNRSDLVRQELMERSKDKAQDLLGVLRDRALLKDVLEAIGQDVQSDVAVRKLTQVCVCLCVCVCVCVCVCIHIHI